MFFLHNLERQVTLHPSYFGRNMHDLVTGKLLKDVEGTCTGQYYIITVMDTFDVSEGRILPGSGLAEFTVRYRAVVWRPFKGETVRYGYDANTKTRLTSETLRWMLSSRLSITRDLWLMPGLCNSLFLERYGLATGHYCSLY
jgi:hypothetical protein